MQVVHLESHVRVPFKSSDRDWDIPSNDHDEPRNMGILSHYSVRLPSKRPPWELSSKRAQMRRLLVQLALFTRKAAPPQLVVIKWLNKLSTHSVRGAGRQPCGVRVSAWARNTP